MLSWRRGDHHGYDIMLSKSCSDVCYTIQVTRNSFASKHCAPFMLNPPKQEISDNTRKANKLGQVLMVE